MYRRKKAKIKERIIWKTDAYASASIYVFIQTIHIARWNQRERERRKSRSMCTER